MAKSRTPSPSSPASSDLAFVARWLGRIFLLGAAGLALYLGVTSLLQGSIAGCEDGGDCHDVISSRWGYLFGIPVSLLGAITYLTLLGSDFAGCCARLHALCRWLILGGAAWFLYVQAAILGQFCPWCCVTHTLAVLGALLLWQRRTRVADDLSAHRHLAPILGIVAVAGLILAQNLGPERPTTAGGVLEKGQGAEVSAPVPEGPRTVALHGGRFSIDVTELPSLGDAAAATHVAVGLFDFTCPHCRELTEILTEVQSTFASDLAILQLPGYFSEKGESIHRIMLALWKEDPDTYHQIASLLHEGALDPNPEDVRAAAGSLVTSDQLNTWMGEHTAWTSQILARSQAIREANRVILNTGKFPQLMLGDYVEAGSKDNAGYYYQLFKEHFGLERTEIPELQVAPSSVSLGEMLVGTSQTFSLTLTNTGGPTVHLSTPQLVRGMRLKGPFLQNLTAGQSTVLEIEAVPPAAGVMQGEIEILSDAEPSVIKVPVDGTAKHVFQATPTFANLGVYQGSPLTGTIDIEFIAPVTVGAPQLNNSNEFKAALTEVEPGLRYQLAVTATPDPKRGGFHQTSIAIPVTPVEAGLEWPRQIRVAARCQVPGAPRPAPRTGAPAPRPQTLSPEELKNLPE